MGVNMGLFGSLEWVNSYSKKQCKSLFWRFRAAIKKTVKGKKQLKFQYDPSSYALNFDDGCCHLGRAPSIAIKPVKLQDSSEGKSTMWVYVVWVKS